MKTIKNILSNAQLIVVKIGSALVVDSGVGVKAAWLAALAEDVMALRAQGKKIVLVTSGAIGLGRPAMQIDLTAASSSIPLERKQAAAAIGQITLMQAYASVFALHKTTVAQILLTPKDTENRREHLNARATLLTLLAQGIIPVINENDTVSTAEIRFGDNDRLAARVAQMIGADVLIQLSTTDGLYTADPRIDLNAAHIPLVEKLDDTYYAMAGDALPGVSTGGMKSKLDAAKIATDSGVHMVIGKGVDLHALKEVIHGHARSTLFLAQDKPINARKKWIMAHVKPKGVLMIDDGADAALVDGKSLLPAGVISVSGVFERGDAVEIHTKNGTKKGIGLIAYDVSDAKRIAGHKSMDISALLGYSRGDEMIHRDDLVVLA